MHILHTENSLGWGGQEIRILTEAQGMQARGHRVALLAPAEALIAQRAAQYDVTCVTAAIGRKNFTGWRAMRRALRELAPDVVNTHSSTDTWLTALALKSMRSALPLVRTRHISAPIPPNASSRWLYTRATRHVVTTGEALREQVMRETGALAANVTSVPTGIDLRRYQPVADAATKTALRTQLGLPENSALIGIVATLRSWKGHRFLIDALALLRAQNRSIHLVIVGDGPQRQSLEEQALARGLKESITFAGNQSDVVPWLQSLDAFALPSYANEGVPQALLQALACALPVVTTNAGAIGEICRPAETALVVVQQDSAALAQALARVLDDEALGKRLGEAGCALVTAKHSLPYMLDQMEAVFNAARGQ